MNRDKLILTDSGGFQVFSLGLSKTKTGKPMAKVHENYVEFTSIHDGSKHIFSPKGVVDIQCNFGSDIMMMLDVCAPVVDINKAQVEKYMHQTHRRAKEQFDYYTNDEVQYNQKK
jgi:queuine tRNA-ribosyltransferase